MPVDHAERPGGSVPDPAPKGVVPVLKEVFRESVQVSLLLFKVMIPIIIGVKILTELGWIRYLALPFSPLMGLVGLPSQAGLIWATAVFNNIYAAIVVYMSLMSDMPVLTTAQATVLGVMILIAHSLPLECKVVQKCGVGFWGQAVLRMIGALACGMIFHLVFSYGNLLAEPSEIAWTAPEKSLPLTLWAWNEIKNLCTIFVLIVGLMLMMRVLNYLRVTDFFIWCLNPVLRFIGIGRDAATITIIGLTLGLSLGSGLIIHEARSGRLSQRDIFSSVFLMGLSHSLIEDTILMLLIGASFYGVFWGRLAFSLVATAVLTRVAARFYAGKDARTD